MKAVFELKEIQQRWQPPFDKSTQTKNFVVEEMGSFDRNDGEEPTFKLVELKNESALIEFSHLYTLKGYESPSSKKIWMQKNQTQSFSALWKDNGITKQLTLVNLVE